MTLFGLVAIVLGAWVVGLLLAACDEYWIPRWTIWGLLWKPLAITLVLAFFAVTLTGIAFGIFTLLNQLCATVVSHD